MSEIEDGEVLDASINLRVFFDEENQTVPRVVLSGPPGMETASFPFKDIEALINSAVALTWTVSMNELAEMAQRWRGDAVAEYERRGVTLTSNLNLNLQ